MDDNVLQVLDVKETDIPEIITSQFSQLKDLKQSVEYAMKKADEAKESADRAYSKSAGVFQRKETIESLQGTVKDLADSQIFMTEAQKVSFEYQKKLGEITRYLFCLGTANLAANRSVVRELQARLKGASKRELDKLAKQEILNVVRQLKAQEDIMNKQGDLSKKVKEQAGSITKQDMQLRQQSSVISEHERLLTENARKNIAQERVLAEKDAKDKAQDQLLKEQAEKNAEHDRLLKELMDKGTEQAQMLKEQDFRNKEQDQQLKALTDKATEQEQLIKAQMAKGVEHDTLLAESASKNIEQDKLLEYLQKENSELKLRADVKEQEFQKLSEHIEEMLSAKANKMAGIFSSVAAGIAVMLALISFFV